MGRRAGRVAARSASVEGGGGPGAGKYREDMLAQDMPAWGSTVLTLASAAVLLGALVVALRALWNLRNRR